MHNVGTRGVAGTVKVEWYTWGDVFTGTREQLVDAGIVSSTTQFPGDPGHRKQMRTRSPEGKEIKIKRNGKSRFDLWRYCSVEEEERRKAQQKMQRTLQETARLRDPIECRKEAENIFKDGFCLVVRSLDLAESGDRGWTYAADDRARALDLLTDLMDIVKGGHIIPRPLKVAGEDEGFSKFMNGLSQR